MKYFTPEMYVRLQDFAESSMDEADAKWESARKRYDRRLKKIMPDLSRQFRRLIENVYLHDAVVVDMGLQKDCFVIVLRLDPPPHCLVILKYELKRAPEIDKNALPQEHASSTSSWLFDEVGIVRSGSRKYYTHSILFANGWEIRLTFEAIQVIIADPLSPNVSEETSSGSHSTVPRSA